MTLVIPTKEESQSLQSLETMYIYKQHLYFIYIVTNNENTVLYIGVTNNLESRLAEHYFNKGNPKTFAVNFIVTILFTLKNFNM